MAEKKDSFNKAIKAASFKNAAKNFDAVNFVKETKAEHYKNASRELKAVNFAKEFKERGIDLANVANVK